MAKKTTKTLTASETFAMNVVKALRSKKIEMKEVQPMKTKDAVGERFASKKAVPGVVLTALKKEDQKNPRYVLTVAVAKDQKHVFTGKPARLAYKALTKVPAAPRKIELSANELSVANEAFGF